jgi:hypothetical protein
MHRTPFCDPLKSSLACSSAREGACYSSFLPFRARPPMSGLSDFLFFFISSFFCDYGL